MTTTDELLDRANEDLDKIVLSTKPKPDNIIRPSVFDGSINASRANRELPKSEWAEQALLAALLHNNAAFEAVSEFLEPWHFYNPLHARLFDDIRKLINQGMVADPVSLAPIFANYEAVKSGEIKVNALFVLATHLVAVYRTEGYGRLIHDLYLRRELIFISEQAVENAYSLEVEPTGKVQLETVEQHLFELASTGDVGGGFAKFNVGLKESMDVANAALTRGGLAGVATGLTDLDKLLGGLQKSDLIIIAGRPSMGKTALVTNIAFNVASNLNHEGLPNIVGFFSLEMSREQLTTRILAEQVGIASEKIRRAEINNFEYERLHEKTRELDSLPFFIDQTRGITVSGIRTRARRLARQNRGELALIIVDYLQLINSVEKVENRVQEIQKITKALKEIAGDLNCPVIALSQLNRGVELRDDKRPQLADLRDSGAIEQDADVVAFIYREEYYLQRSEPKSDSDKIEKWSKSMEYAKGKAELQIAKQRHGPVGKVVLAFNSELTKFSDYDGGFNY